MEEQNQIKLFLEKNRIILIIGFVLFCILYLYVHLPPSDFPLGTVITINPGQSLQSITETLYDAHVIKYQFVFRTHVIIQGGEKKVIAGDYLLDHAEGPADLAYRVVHGQFHLTAVKATIPEGWNIFDIRDYLKKNLINFDSVGFINLAKSKEGYLFPDTYFLSPTSKPEKIIKIMNDTFNQKILTVPGIATTTRKLKDIITMASILEGEARTTNDRRIIAGILLRRLSLGIPLQVDSTFSYINGKNTYDLTVDDLKINSPYNTYLYTGLPPGPINNPGLDSIFSVINPITTKYLYFLSSKSGKVYYAKTFEEHIQNKQLYLNK